MKKTPPNREKRFGGVFYTLCGAGSPKGGYIRGAGSDPASGTTTFPACSAFW